MIYRLIKYIFYRRTHGSGNNTSTETTSYSNHEVYTKQKVVVHSGPSLPPVVVVLIMMYFHPLLCQGVHCFPFSFVLPTNLPSSFESHTGNVR